ncbi:hypothetical protein SISSUDRAFT_1068192 [Sistotremastrum suecicum HHB10207 ss-3]|uniref:Uncharacterized protein n=1 Tax=Sistotremastrum suecicum HHB10207 ss-3 TaxID=1314776 RepID=A0A165WDY3_9AGAM|nr:hypothetical protein SISSUDRAFT_1068192 [Sistotremastrum suecicum HHB10207 ss-3]
MVHSGLTIPPEVSQALLLGPSASVHSLLALERVPHIYRSPYPPPPASHFLVRDAPPTQTTQELIALLPTLHCPDKDTVQGLMRALERELKQKDKKTHPKSLAPRHLALNFALHLPLFVIQYWDEVHAIHEHRAKWMAALQWANAKVRAAQEKGTTDDVRWDRLVQQLSTLQWQGLSEQKVAYRFPYRTTQSTPSLGDPTRLAYEANGSSPQNCRTRIL